MASEQQTSNHFSELGTLSATNSMSSNSSYQEVTAAFIAPAGTVDNRQSVLTSLVVQNATPRTAFNSSPRHNHSEVRHVFVQPGVRDPSTTPAPWDGEKSHTPASPAGQQKHLSSSEKLAPGAAQQWPARACSLQELEQGDTPAMQRWVRVSELKSDGQGLSDPLVQSQPTPMPAGPMSAGQIPGDRAVPAAQAGKGQGNSGEQYSAGGGMEGEQGTQSGNSASFFDSLSPSKQNPGQQNAAQQVPRGADKGFSAASAAKPGASTSAATPTGTITAIKGKGSGATKDKGWAALRSKPLNTLNKDLWQQAAQATAHRRESAAAAAPTSPTATTGRKIGTAAAAEAADTAETAAAPVPGGAVKLVAPDSPSTSSLASGSLSNRRPDPIAAAAAAKSLRSQQQNAWKKAFDVSRKLKVASAVTLSGDSNHVLDHPSRGPDPEESWSPHGASSRHANSRNGDSLARGGVSAGMLSASSKSRSAGHHDLPYVSPLASDGARDRSRSSRGDTGSRGIASSPRASGGCPSFLILCENILAVGGNCLLLCLYCHTDRHSKAIIMTADISFRWHQCDFRPQHKSA